MKSATAARRRQPESKVVAECLRVLRSYGHLAWRNSVGAAKLHGQWVHFGVRGLPDITGFLATPYWQVPSGRGIAVECKRPGRLGGVRREQSEFLNHAHSVGAFVAVVDSAEMLRQMLEAERGLECEST